MKVAFIGLGVMGYPMAGHLKNAGMQVCVYNRSQEKARQWCEQYGGEMASTPAAAAQDCEVVLVCVGNDDDVRQVVLGDSGALAGMAALAMYFVPRRMGSQRPYANFVLMLILSFSSR